MDIHKKELILLTRSLRHKQTPWENKLWRYLRAGRFKGLKFKRQVMIGEYVVDFCCNKKKIIIELDGGQHNDEVVGKYDLARSKYIESFGYKVLRFWNNEVDGNIEGVLEVMRKSVS